MSLNFIRLFSSILSMETAIEKPNKAIKKQKDDSKRNLLVKLRALRGDLKLYLALSSVEKTPKGYQAIPEQSLLGQSIIHAKEGDIISLTNFSPPYQFLVLQVSG